jgi:hypothetical protein
MCAVICPRNGPCYDYFILVIMKFTRRMARRSQAHATLAPAAATAPGPSRDWNDAAGTRLSGDF